MQEHKIRPKIKLHIFISGTTADANTSTKRGPDAFVLGHVVAPCGWWLSDLERAAKGGKLKAGVLTGTSPVSRNQRSKTPPARVRRDR